MRKLLFFILFIGASCSYAQELNCTVVVSYDKITNVNTQIFKSLEKSLNDFVNKNAWTDKTYKDNEKINCSMFITINSYENNNFECSIQVQSSRPVFNSLYTTPVLNINDKDFNFQYIEFQNMYFNPNSFDSNLMSAVAFYCYIIIGVDAETFGLDSGDPYLQTAQNIAGTAMSSGVAGWSQSEQKQNRYYLINDLLSQTFKPFREALFQYDFMGLDTMYKDQKKSKEAIIEAINKLSEIQDLRPNAFLTRVFFDAKSDELVSIFTGGPAVDLTKLVNQLNRLSPTNSFKWNKIKS
ncbi:DUF4835 family protein [Flavobacterium sp. SUN046]|uniref:type IX secretion system protein PorD n=1 Tax=Flavobacterium sp. SUN046 TaxID=3002440 RepID=UPI002DB768BA|nr:DUF4835 family protein [Flavobacterium sp. SUN046]MEC4050553.1 DUF4835 family protein [Flavobacterium sp. SUN046]